jgi:hypothetical protein
MISKPFGPPWLKAERMVGTVTRVPAGGEVRSRGGEERRRYVDYGVCVNYLGTDATSEYLLVSWIDETPGLEYVHILIPRITTLLKISFPVCLLCVTWFNGKLIQNAWNPSRCDFSERQTNQKIGHRLT